MSKILINKSHLFHNLREIEKKLGDKNKISVVLKDNAYGHGIEIIGKLCSDYGVKKAVVRSYQEAEKISQFFDDILILSDIPNKSYSHYFHIAVNSINDLEKIQKNTKIHLKVNSGMHRNGISPKELKIAFYRALELKLEIVGVFTHYKNADELGSEFFSQKECFKMVKKEVLKICEKLYLPIPIFHSYNSSAVFRDNFCNDDMVRVGIALYGYCENNKIFERPYLKPVLSLYTNKISTLEVSKYNKIGYGGKGKIEKKETISTYDIGYGDGFFRLNEFQNYYTPQGHKVIGRVSMDNLCLNSIDDEVCLFDDVRELAKIHNTISYEILTNLKPNIKRVIV